MTALSSPESRGADPDATARHFLMVWRLPRNAGYLWINVESTVFNIISMIRFVPLPLPVASVRSGYTPQIRWAAGCSSKQCNLFWSQRATLDA
jgi:hypothetical protein